MDTVTPATKTPLRDKLTAAWTQASYLRRQARQTLNRGGGRHRLTLLLAYAIVMTAAVGLYIVASGIYTLVYLLLDPKTVSEALMSGLADLLFALLSIFLLLPLWSGAQRLACLMTAPPDGQARGHAVTAPPPVLSQLFYPFSSPRAYGRSMAVGMESLGWVLAAVVVPCLVYTTVRPLLTVPSLPRWTVTALLLFPCILWGLGVFCLSGKRAGFGYFVFLHEDMPLRDADSYFRSFRRPLLEVLFWRLPLLGWAAISVVAVLIPLLPHTLPYGACCTASYGRYLEDPKG